jgi:hypothetical protein
LIIEPPRHRLIIPCADQDRRDIHRTPFKAKVHNIASSIGVRLHALVAILLSEIMNRDVDIHEEMVSYRVEELKSLGNYIHGHIIDAIAKQNNITLREAIDTRWSYVPDEIQDKYCLLYEKKVYKELGLDIGRCQKMWAVRSIMVQINSTVHSHKNIEKVWGFLLKCEMSFFECLLLF